MPPEKSTHPKTTSRKSWSCQCFPSCFVGSLISASGGPDPPSPSAGSKPKLSWSRYRKKKKTAPLDGVRPNIKASAQENSPFKKPSEGRTSRSRGNAQQLQRDADSQLHHGIDAEQPRLPRISKQYSTRREEVPASWKPHTVRTRCTTNDPGSPAHIHPAASHKRPVRTGSLKPGAGIWVMVMTLGVMVFLGRASALICLCSCMYLVPLLSMGKDGVSDGNGVASREVEMNSEEYKKRVILEGLLERNGRKPSGF
uniref:Uncharacterized protein At5g23160-like n=1 Tax=Elaeis guineensis var. tenera TaxID=51953 RepID=A0A6J0PCZ3_ELAGV|nr:uncharacterized protein At5g23160-like [Elaeis guineensis]